MDSEECMKNKLSGSLFRMGLILALAQLFIFNSQLLAQPATNCVQCPSGLIAWWPGDGNATNLVGTNYGTLYNGATNVSGIVDGAFSFDGANDYFAAPDQSLYSPHVGTNGEMTVMAWIRVSSYPSTSRPFIAKGTSSAWEYALYLTPSGAAQFSLWTLVGNDYASVAAGTVNLGQWHHVAGVLRKGQFTRLYLDGVQVGEDVTFSGDTGDGGASFYIGARGGGPFFPGLVDEVALFNRALASNQIVAIYTAGANGMCKDALPPTLLTWPTNQFVALGSNVTLAVTASGTPPLSFQWLFYGTNLPTATNSTLNLQPSTLSDTGPYSVLVSNAYGRATSPAAVLTVVPPPVITAQPQSQTKPMGYPVTFSVTADSLAPLSYQWLFNSSPAPGATNSTLILTNLTLDQAGDYTVVARNFSGSVTSAVAHLVVLQTTAMTNTTAAGLGADSYVQASAANNNFGTSDSVWVKTDLGGLGNSRKGYLRFDMRSLSDFIVEARFELIYAANGDTPANPSTYNREYPG
jgi:hypothetical protein